MKTTNHADDPIKIRNLSLSVFTLYWLPNCIAYISLILNFFLLASLIFAFLTFKQGGFTKFLDLLLKSEPFLDSFWWHILDLYICLAQPDMVVAHVIIVSAPVQRIGFLGF